MMNLDKQKIKKPISGSGIFLTALLFVTIITISLFTYYKSQGADLSKMKVVDMFSIKTIKKTSETAKQQKKITELSYEPAEHPVFCIYQQNIIKCTHENVSAIDKNGSEIWSINIAMNEPMIKTNGKQLLVADIGGRNLSIIEGDRVKWDIKNDTDIINADISKSGFVTVIQKVKSYRSRITLYDKLGIEIFHRDIAEDNIISAIVSPNSKYIALNGINATGVNVAPVLDLVDINGEVIKFQAQLADNILPFVNFIGDESIIAAGENNLYFYTSDWKQKWKVSPGTLESCGVIGDKMIVSSKNQVNGETLSKGTSVISIYSKKGSKVSSYEFGQDTKNIKTYNNIAAVNSGDSIVFIDSNGKIKGKYSSTQEIIDVFFFDNSEALVVTKLNMEIVSIN